MSSSLLTSYKSYARVGIYQSYVRVIMGRYPLKAYVWVGIYGAYVRVIKSKMENVCHNVPVTAS